MKKIAFFLGRYHHAQKLMPIAQYGEAHEIFDSEIIVADNAINIDPPTEFLGRYGIGKFHHSKQNQSPIDDADVHKAIRALYQSDLIYSVSPFWLSYSAREAVENISGFRNYLKSSNPDAVFVLHTQNFWAKILAYQAHNVKIPVYSIQEGIILENEEKDMGKYAGATEYVDSIFTWSEYDRQFYGNKGIINPVGPTHLDQWVHLKQDPPKLASAILELQTLLGLPRSAKIITVAFPRLDLFKGNPEKALRAVCSWSVRRGHTVVLTLHPFQGRVPEFEQVIDIFPNAVLFSGENPMALVACSDVVLAQTGTLPLEAIAVDTPVGEMNLDNELLDQPLHKQGGAMLIDEIGNIEALLDGENRESAEKFKKERLPLADGWAMARLAEQITK
jgi:hypothetical protein